MPKNSKNAVGVTDRPADVFAAATTQASCTKSERDLKGVVVLKTLRDDGMDSTESEADHIDQPSSRAAACKDEEEGPTKSALQKRVEELELKCSMQAKKIEQLEKQLQQEIGRTRDVDPATFTVDFTDAAFEKRERRASVLDGVDLGARDRPQPVEEKAGGQGGTASVAPVDVKDKVEDGNQDAEAGGGALEQKQTEERGGQGGTALVAPGDVEDDSQDATAGEGALEEKQTEERDKQGQEEHQQEEEDDDGRHQEQQSQSRVVRSLRASVRMAGTNRKYAIHIPQENREKQIKAAKLIYAKMRDVSASPDLTAEEALAKVKASVSELGPFQPFWDTFCESLSRSLCSLHLPYCTVYQS